MGLLDKFRRRDSGMVRGGPTGSTVRGSDSEDARHLRDWAGARRGVEGFVEPRTTVSEVTLLLVAHDGEWTRRRVPSVQWAHDFANKNRVPSYDAAVVGVPQRMRDYNARQKAERKSRGY